MDFFGRLFDFSFQRFVTPTIVRVLFAISIAASILAGLALMLRGGGWIVLGPIAAVFWIIVSRIFYEVLIVIFMIAENTRRSALAAPGPMPGSAPAKAPPQPKDSDGSSAPGATPVVTPSPLDPPRGPAETSSPSAGEADPSPAPDTGSPPPKAADDPLRPPFCTSCGHRFSSDEATFCAACGTPRNGFESG